MIRALVIASLLLLGASTAHAGRKVDTRGMPRAAARLAGKLARALDADTSRKALALLPAELGVDGIRRPKAWLRDAYPLDDTDGTWAVIDCDPGWVMYRGATRIALVKVKKTWRVQSIATTASEDDRCLAMFDDPADPPAAVEITPERIRGEVKRIARTLQRCYRDRLEQDPDATAPTELGFTITATGAVDATVAGGDPTIAACFEKALETMQFPPPAGGAIQVRYPLTADAQP